MNDLSKLSIPREQRAVRRAGRPWRLPAALAVLLAAVLTWRYGGLGGVRELDIGSVTTAWPSQAVTLFNATGYVVPQSWSKVGAKIPGRLARVLQRAVEGAGLPLLEAFHEGLPVACSDIAALRWWDVLREFESSLSALYLSIGGAVWCVAGSVLFWGVVSRKSWLCSTLLASAVLWYGQYWVERIFFQAAPANTGHPAGPSSRRRTAANTMATGTLTTGGISQRRRSSGNA